MAVEKMKVSSLALKADAIITLPVMKSHMHAVASLGLKNMKGCLHGKQKRDFHHLGEKPRFAAWQDYKPIDRAIADLFAVLPPFATVVDAVVAMEGLGPLLGEPKPLDLVLASRVPLAADLAAWRSWTSPRKGLPPGLAARHAGRGAALLAGAEPGPGGLRGGHRALQARRRPGHRQAVPGIRGQGGRGLQRLPGHGQRLPAHPRAKVCRTCQDTGGPGARPRSGRAGPGGDPPGQLHGQAQGAGALHPGLPAGALDIVKAIAERDRGRG